MTKPAFTPEQWAHHLSGEAPIKRAGETEIALGVYATLHENPNEVPDHGVVYDLAFGIEEPRPFLCLHWTTVSERATVHYRRHGLAALALHRMPYGFSHDELAKLREVADWWRYFDQGECPRCEHSGFKMSARPICTNCGWQPQFHPDDILEAVTAIAAKISALLPPRSP